MSAAWTPEQLLMLRRAREAYRAQPGIEHYDDVLREVCARAEAGGDLGKADIGALLFWKRLRADTRWAMSLHLLPDSSVRAATRAARNVMAGCPQLGAAACAGRSALVELPGFRLGDALASAVLTALAPDRMAIYDRHAHVGLHRLGIDLTNRAGRYSRYMRHVEELSTALTDEEESWINRDVDLALFTIGAAARP